MSLQSILLAQFNWYLRKDAHVQPRVIVKSLRVGIVMQLTYGKNFVYSSACVFACGMILKMHFSNP